MPHQFMDAAPSTEPPAHGLTDAQVEEIERAHKEMCDATNSRWKTAGRTKPAAAAGRDTGDVTDADAVRERAYADFCRHTANRWRHAG